MWIIILAESALGQDAREAALVELRKSTKATQFVPIPMVKIVDVIRKPEDLQVWLAPYCLPPPRQSVATF